MTNLITSSLLLLALLLPATAAAYDFEVDGIYYDINGNEATVTFYGHPYTGDVIIPSTITYNGKTYPVIAIGDFAFAHSYGLTSVSIPNSVSAIGQQAFRDCGLMSLTIPNSVTIIGSLAFAYCSSLSSMTIPDLVTTISEGMFAGCSNLTSVTIPNSVTSIGNEAFNYCYNLTNVTIPDSVTYIGDNAFYHCDSLTNVTIPNSVTSIGSWAFANCSGLTNVTIPNSVTSIGRWVFAYSSSLSSVTIGNSVQSVEGNMFAHCESLEGLVVANGNTTYDSRNNCNAVIETANNTLIVGCKNTVIPNSITTIGEEAFLECDGLTSMSIPNSVTSIGNRAFFDCRSLTSVTIPNSVTSIGIAALGNCWRLANVYCYIINPSSVSVKNIFFIDNDYYDYSGRALHVPQGTAAAYQADETWYPYFGQIVEDLMPDHQPGDVNCDGEVNIADVNAVINIILKGNSPTADADVNGDGEINIADINAVIDIILAS